MKQKKLMCIWTLFLFTLSGTSVYAAAPGTGKTIGKQNSNTSVLVEPTAVPKITPETKAGQKKTKQHNQIHQRNKHSQRKQK